MQPFRILAVFFTALAITLPCPAKDHPPTGILAASVGDSVVLIEPVGGRTVSFDTGPVGWLFPAPGGMLFAPDVINARTTVLSLGSAAVVDKLDGLTMPHFGGSPDRYIAIAGEVILLSYPDRAVIKRIPAEIHHPWQVIVSPDDAAMLVLERLPDGSTGVHMATVNLITRQVIQSRPLAGNIVHMALSPQLGLLALADADSGQIHLVEPATLNPMASRSVAGQPLDVAFARGGGTLAAAVATGNGAGAVDLAVFKSGKKRVCGSTRSSRSPLPPPRSGSTRRRQEPMSPSPSRADPWPSSTSRNGPSSAQYKLPGTPRDLRWCDIAREGPMVADWSDGEAPPEFGTFAPKVKDDKSSGSEEPSWVKPPN